MPLHWCQWYQWLSGSYFCFLKISNQQSFQESLVHGRQFKPKICPKSFDECLQIWEKQGYLPSLEPAIVTWKSSSWLCQEVRDSYWEGHLDFLQRSQKSCERFLWRFESCMHVWTRNRCRRSSCRITRGNSNHRRWMWCGKARTRGYKDHQDGQLRSTVRWDALQSEIVRHIYWQSLKLKQVLS